MLGSSSSSSPAVAQSGSSSATAMMYSSTDLQGSVRLSSTAWSAQPASNAQAPSSAPDVLSSTTSSQGSVAVQSTAPSDMASPAVGSSKAIVSSDTNAPGSVSLTSTNSAIQMTSQLVTAIPYTTTNAQGSAVIATTTSAYSSSSLYASATSQLVSPSIYSMTTAQGSVILLSTMPTSSGSSPSSFSASQPSYATTGSFEPLTVATGTQSTNINATAQPATTKLFTIADSSGQTVLEPSTEEVPTAAMSTIGAFTPTDKSGKTAILSPTVSLTASTKYSVKALSMTDASGNSIDASRGEPAPAETTSGSPNAGVSSATSFLSAVSLRSSSAAAFSTEKMPTSYDIANPQFSTVSTLPIALDDNASDLAKSSSAMSNDNNAIGPTSPTSQSASMSPADRTNPNDPQAAGNIVSSGSLEYSASTGLQKSGPSSFSTMTLKNIIASHLSEESPSSSITSPPNPPAESSISLSSVEASDSLVTSPSMPTFALTPASPSTYFRPSDASIGTMSKSPASTVADDSTLRTSVVAAKDSATKSLSPATDASEVAETPIQGVSSATVSREVDFDLSGQRPRPNNRPNASQTNPPPSASAGNDVSSSNAAKSINSIASKTQYTSPSSGILAGSSVQSVVAGSEAASQSKTGLVSDNTGTASSQYGLQHGGWPSLQSPATATARFNAESQTNPYSPSQPSNSSEMDSFSESSHASSQPNSAAVGGAPDMKFRLGPHTSDSPSVPSASSSTPLGSQSSASGIAEPDHSTLVSNSVCESQADGRSQALENVVIVTSSSAITSRVSQTQSTPSIELQEPANAYPSGQVRSSAVGQPASASQAQDSIGKTSTDKLASSSGPSTSAKAGEAYDSNVAASAKTASEGLETETHFGQQVSSSELSALPTQNDGHTTKAAPVAQSQATAESITSEADSQGSSAQSFAPQGSPTQIKPPHGTHVQTLSAQASSSGSVGSGAQATPPNQGALPAQDFSSQAPPIMISGDTVPAAEGAFPVSNSAAGIDTDSSSVGGSSSHVSTSMRSAQGTSSQVSSVAAKGSGAPADQSPSISISGPQTSKDDASPNVKAPSSTKDVAQANQDAAQPSAAQLNCPQLSNSTYAPLLNASLIAPLSRNNTVQSFVNSTLSLSTHITALKQSLKGRFSDYLSNLIASRGDILQQPVNIQQGMQKVGSSNETETNGNETLDGLTAIREKIAMDIYFMEVLVNATYKHYEKVQNAIANECR